MSLAARALTFAFRSLVRQPARAVLGVLGVAAVGALLFDMLMLSRGLIVSLRDLLGTAGFDVRVAATDALIGPPIKELSQTLATLEALPELKDVVPLRFGQAQALGRGRAPLDLTLIGAGGTRRQWTVLEGSDLDSRGSGGPAQALVNRALAKDLGLRPGAEVSLRASCGPPGAAPPVTPFRVTGIAAFPFEETAERAAAVGLEGYRLACANEDPDQADLLLVASKEAAGPDSAVAAIARARPDLHAFTNEQIVARFARVEFSYFRQISTVLASLTLFFGFLLVTVLLTVSVNQRFGEIATLRALGFSRGRVVADVLCQAALLVGTGGALALPLGLTLSSRLDAILKAMPELPANVHFFVCEPRTLGLHVALLSLTAICAALYPIWLVSRLEIATTLRNEVVS
jgi:putative ABC transport system permease protein